MPIHENLQLLYLHVPEILLLLVNSLLTHTNENKEKSAIPYRLFGMGLDISRPQLKAKINLVTGISPQSLSIITSPNMLSCLEVSRYYNHSHVKVEEDSAGVIRWTVYCTIELVFQLP